MIVSGSRRTFRRVKAIAFISNCFWLSKKFCSFYCAVNHWHWNDFHLRRCVYNDHFLTRKCPANIHAFILLHFYIDTDFFLLLYRLLTSWLLSLPGMHICNLIETLSIQWFISARPAIKVGAHYAEVDAVTSNDMYEVNSFSMFNLHSWYQPMVAHTSVVWRCPAGICWWWGAHSQQHFGLCWNAILGSVLQVVFSSSWISLSPWCLTD